MGNSYSYPDRDDCIISRFIQTHEPWSGYWKASEQWILQRAKSHIQANYDGRTDLHLLDAGCGTGRLLIKFNESFTHIVAVDPDEYQLRKAKATVLSHQMKNKVTFICKSLEALDLPIHTFDVILCSHILQHLATPLVDQIFDLFSKVLKPKGLLLLTVAYSRVPVDTYSLTTLAKSKVVERPITKEEFDACVCQKSENILPTHHFALDTISKRLTQRGFSIMESKVFHTLFAMPLLNRLNRYANWDAIINIFPVLKRRCGRDLFVVVKR